MGSELFGDDLTGRLKTVKESKKAAKQLTGHKRKRNEEYSRSSYSNRGGHFFIQSPGALPTETPLVEKQLSVHSKRQPEHV